MPDHISASFSIGGVLSMTALPELIRLIDEGALGPDENGPFQNEMQVRSHLFSGASGVTLHANEVRRGVFDHLQAFCVEHGLTYRLSHGGISGSWTPDRFRQAEVPDDAGAGSLDEDERSTLSADQIRRLGGRTVKAILTGFVLDDDLSLPPFFVHKGAATPLRATAPAVSAVAVEPVGPDDLTFLGGDHGGA